MLAHDYDYQYYSGSHYDSNTGTTGYWSATGSSSETAVFGQTIDVTLTNPAGLSPNDVGVADAIWSVQANSSSSLYGWDMNTVSWALTGDVAEFDLTQGDGNDVHTVSNTSFLTVNFKDSGNYRRDIPAAGTYNLTLTASVPGKSDVVWNITVVIS